MKLGAVALDYDGTIATEGVMDSGVRDAIAQLRLHGIAVVLATGRRLYDLKAVAGNLECFNAVVAENGAVLYFPESQRHVVMGHAPAPAFVKGLRQLGILFDTGDCVVETGAVHALSVLQLIQSLELPLTLAFNRSRLMVLPPAFAKSIGLARVLATLRLSIHNTVGIGEAENDHDLLDACEGRRRRRVGQPSHCAAVADGNHRRAPAHLPSPPICYGSVPRQISELFCETRDWGVRPRAARVTCTLAGRVQLAIRGAGTGVIIAGEPGSGKTWLAGSSLRAVFDPAKATVPLPSVDPEAITARLETH
jgi:hypothetical protein